MFVVVVVMVTAMIMVVGSCGGSRGGGGGGGDRNGSEVYDDEMLICRDLFQYILLPTSRSSKGLSVFLLQFSSLRNFI